MLLELLVLVDVLLIVEAFDVNVADSVDCEFDDEIITC
jgi:hypothetical protein